MKQMVQSQGIYNFPLDQSRMSPYLCILEEKFPTVVIKAHCVLKLAVIGEGESRERTDW